MRRFLATALTVFLTCMAAHAAKPYLCDSPGSRLQYVRTDVGSGKVVWNHTMDVLSSEASSGKGRTVSFVSTFTKKNGKKLLDPVEYKAAIDAEGNATTDISGTIRAVISSFFPNAEISCAESSSTLPAQLVPGSTLPDAHATMSAIGQKISVDVTNRKVLRYDTLETEAGKFECVVVTESKKERYGAVKRDTVSQTWYSRGVGMVRHDTWKNGKLETSEVLVSLRSL